MRAFSGSAAADGPLMVLAERSNACAREITEPQSPCTLYFLFNAVICCDKMLYRKGGTEEGIASRLAWLNLVNVALLVNRVRVVRWSSTISSYQVV